MGSGFRFNSLGMQCCNEGFTGLEFAAGIPGTVGGAVYMNAGANGQVIQDGSFFQICRLFGMFGASGG